MKPYKVTFYVYSDNDNDVEQLQDQLNNFVREKYNNGILVTAIKLSSALKKFCNNFFVTNYLK